MIVLAGHVTMSICIEVVTCSFINKIVLSFSDLTKIVRGLPLTTYAPRGGGGVKSPIHFQCVLHAKRGGGGPDSM